MTSMVDPTLRDVGREQMAKIVALAREHDPDVVTVFVLHGSEERGIAVSLWAPEGGSRQHALDLIASAVVQMADAGGLQLPGDR